MEELTKHAKKVNLYLWDNFNLAKQKVATESAGAGKDGVRIPL